MKHEYLNPPTLPDWSGMFSQVVLTEKNGLKFVHISGQVGVDHTKKMVGDGSLRTQTKSATGFGKCGRKYSRCRQAAHLRGGL